MAEKKPIIISTGNEITRPWVIPNTPKEFVRTVRERYHWSPNQGLVGENLLQVSEDLRIFPVAYLFEDAHWMLIARADNAGLTIYDPTSGIGLHPYTFKQQARFLREIGKHYFFQGGDIMRLNEHGYSLPEIPLQRLGRLQYTDADCGLLAVFAAIQARKPFVIKS